MNPELIKRPREVAIYKAVDERVAEILHDHSRSRFAILLLGLGVGFFLGLFWKWIFEWIF